MGPTTAGGLKVYAADRSAPVNTVLHWAAKQPPTSTEVVVPLSADGKVKVHNGSGRVNVLLDIEGYYQPHNHDDRYFTKQASDERFFEGSTLVLVRADGTPADNGAALAAAIAGIADASATKPYTVRLAPGLYDVGTGGLAVPPFVDLLGSGQDRTVITAPGATDLFPSDGGVYGTVRIPGDTALRDLTVTSTGGTSTIAVAVAVEGGANAAVLSNVTARASGGSGGFPNDIGVAPAVDQLSAPLLVVEDSEVVVDNGFGIGQLNGTDPFGTLDVRRSSITVTGGGGGITADADFGTGSGIRIVDSDISLTGGGTGIGSSSVVGRQYLVDGTRVTVTGGSSSVGLGGSGTGFHPEVVGSTIKVSGATTSNKGYDCAAGCSLAMRDSSIAAGGTAAIGLELGFGTNNSGAATVDQSVVSATTVINSINAATSVSVGASQLAGTTIVNGAGTFVCAASYKSTYAALSATCT